MPEDIRIWKILEKEDLKELKKAKLNLEERLEKWLEKDISIISNDLLVIGKQVETTVSGVIDLLCLDKDGDVVILELKRDKTPREITAQILEYASWVKDLSNDQVTRIANEYLKDNGPLEDAFKKKFNSELPEVLNERHQMLVIGSEIDSRSERIIKYLSDTYGVWINAVTFQYFHDEGGKELLARVFLIEPSQAEEKSERITSSKRKPPRTLEELKEIAQNNGVGELCNILIKGLGELFNRTGTTRSSIAFIGIVGENQRTVLSLIPKESNSNDGLKFQVFTKRLSNYFGVEEQKVIALLPKNKEPWEYYRGAPPDLSGFAGYFKNSEEVNSFLIGLNKIGTR